MRSARWLSLALVAMLALVALGAQPAAASDTKGCDYRLKAKEARGLSLRVIATTNISCPNAVRAAMASADACSEASDGLLAGVRAGASGRKPKQGWSSRSGRCRHRGYSCRMTTRSQASGDLFDAFSGSARASARTTLFKIRARVSLHCMKGPKRRYGFRVSVTAAMYADMTMTPSLR